jgi:hypothetical protein
MITLKELIEKHPRLLELPIDIFETMYNPDDDEDVESLISSRFKPTQEQLNAVKDVIVNRIKTEDLVKTQCGFSITFSHKGSLTIDDKWNGEVYKPTQAEFLSNFAYYAIGDWYEEDDLTISDLKEMLKYFETQLEIKY